MNFTDSIYWPSRTRQEWVQFYQQQVGRNDLTPEQRQVVNRVFNALLTWGHNGELSMWTLNCCCLQNSPWMQRNVSVYKSILNSVLQGLYNKKITLEQSCNIFSSFHFFNTFANLDPYERAIWCRRLCLAYAEHAEVLHLLHPIMNQVRTDFDERRISRETWLNTLDACPENFQAGWIDYSEQLQSWIQEIISHKILPNSTNIRLIKRNQAMAVLVQNPRLCRDLAVYWQSECNCTHLFLSTFSNYFFEIVLRSQPSQWRKQQDWTVACLQQFCLNPSGIYIYKDFFYAHWKGLQIDPSDLEQKRLFSIIQRNWLSLKNELPFDLTVQSEGKSIPCIRFMACMSCPYFERALLGGFLEGGSNKVLINEPYVFLTIFMHLIHRGYLPPLQEVSFELIAELLQWSLHWEKFSGLEGFFSKCERQVFRDLNIQQLKDLSLRLSSEVLSASFDLASYFAGSMSHRYQGVSCSVDSHNHWTLWVENLSQEAREAVCSRIALVNTLVLQNISLFEGQIGSLHTPIEDFTGVLDLSVSQLSDEQVELLPNLLPNCMGLKLHANSPLLSVVLATASSWKQIIHLQCEDLSDKQLERICVSFQDRLSELHTLSFSGTKIRSKVLTDQLKTIKNLTQLRACGVKLTSQLLFRCLVQVSNTLEEFDLSSCNIPRAQGTHVNNVTTFLQYASKLRSLRLKDTSGAIPELVGEVFKHLTSLEEIHLSGYTHDAEMLVRQMTVANKCALRSLRIEDVDLNCHELVKIAEAHPTLNDLSSKVLYGYLPQSLRELGKNLPQLNTLKLHGPVGYPVEDEFPWMTQFPQLRSLELPHMIRLVAENFLGALGTHCPKLEEIKLKVIHGGPLEKGWENLAEGCKDLRKVDARAKVPSQALTPLLQKCKKLSHLHIETLMGPGFDHQAPGWPVSLHPAFFLTYSQRINPETVVISPLKHQQIS